MEDATGVLVESVMARFTRLNYADNHAAGTFPTQNLAEIERLLPVHMEVTAETGCGKSTILLSNLAARHHVFALDDRSWDSSSVAFYRSCPLTQLDRVVEHFGPTQRTLPTFRHSEKYDALLLDGPHGWPFPELEYYFFYPHVKTGGLLIVDDVNIPTIGRMADVMAEDEMWSVVAIVGNMTAVFRRTDAPLFDPCADGWWTQKFNRKRVSKAREIYLAEPVKDVVSSQRLDSIIHR
jgi:hypothetical protein